MDPLIREVLGGMRSATSVTPASESVFDPPFRGIVATGAGDVVVTLADDNPSDTAKKVTIALTAKIPNTALAIRKVWNAGTTATGLMGLR